MDVAERQRVEALVQGAGYSLREVDWLQELCALISTERNPVSYSDLFAAALKKPSLFRLKPETIRRNIDNVSMLLHLSIERLVGAALKEPALFSVRPEALDGKAARSIVAKLGVKRGPLYKRTLQVMRTEGLIATMPIGMAPRHLPARGRWARAPKPAR